MVQGCAKSYVKIHVNLFILFYCLKVSNRIKKIKELNKERKMPTKRESKDNKKKKITKRNNEDRKRYKRGSFILDKIYLHRF